ncbi:MAG: hypothetical protein D6819_07790 [Gammaproteobacteria bacterium]|nr:MAG: hypothetical protein D6819_07790 [Gammaproteobacteria bacterium]
MGPDHSVVAFSAICSHQLVHPSAKMALISYQSQPGQVWDKPGAIVCCAHASVFDPSQGAKVLLGPAPQPLAAIILEEGDDGIYATGVQGGEMFHEFFRAFRKELRKEFGRGAAKHEVKGTAEVLPLEAYSKSVIHC